MSEYVLPYEIALALDRASRDAEYAEYLRRQLQLHLAIPVELRRFGNMLMLYSPIHGRYFILHGMRIYFIAREICRNPIEVGNCDALQRLSLPSSHAVYFCNNYVAIRRDGYYMIRPVPPQIADELRRCRVRRKDIDRDTL